MNKRSRMMRGVLGLVVWVGIGFSVAQAAVILPVDPATRLPIPGASVTVSILNPNGADITDAWLPEPGQTVTIRVNGLVDSLTLILVFDQSMAANPIANAALTTSAYPGVCTNFGSHADLSPDFTLVRNQLTSLDCGGMAVIQVGGTTLTFILPQDSDFDGIPDIWEARFCPADTPHCLVADADIDTGPENNPQIGDGIANFDEYRGFMVSGTHVQTDPTQKDLFFNLDLDNPQCVSTATLRDATGDLIQLASFFPDVSTLVATLGNIISERQLHRLATSEWVDNFASYAVATRVTLDPVTDAAKFDRQINQNAIYPRRDAVTGLTIQKGIRFIQCLDLASFSPLGSADQGTPNGIAKDAGNAILFPQRIVDYLTTTRDRNRDGVPDGLIPAGGSRKLRFSTFLNGAWTTPTLVGDGEPTKPENIDFISARSMEFYLGMEGGHSWKLTPTTISNRKTDYGYHFPPFTGDSLDQGIIQKIDSKSTGFNTFYIPSRYGSADRASFRVKD